MGERFIGEAIRPVGSAMDTSRIARGEPALPMRFAWRGREYRVEAVLERCKETGPCRSGADERYVRKHWFRIRTSDGIEMRIYFERQARSGRGRGARWWLYALRPGRVPHETEGSPHT
jgi:hypothetical protein